MKTSLDHLPDNTQHAITAIRRLILNEVDKFIETKEGQKALNRVTWIILFGSYARGDYVDAPATGYVSDVDLLVVSNLPELVSELGLWNAIEEKAERHTQSPLTLIVHSQEEVLRWLSQGHYFFSDIAKEGIYLYAYSGKPLPEPHLLTNAERLPVAEKHYAQWFESAVDFVAIAQSQFEKEKYKLSAFQLHQAVERFYACYLLVVTNYRPKTHNLKILRRKAIAVASHDSAFSPVFPDKNRFQKRCFDLLRRAYIDARYSEHFNITPEELAWLFNEVSHLSPLVEHLCLAHIERLKSDAQS